MEHFIAFSYTRQCKNVTNMAAATLKTDRYDVTCKPSIVYTLRFWNKIWKKNVPIQNSDQNKFLVTAQ